MQSKLNYRDAAALLGVPVGTLYAWVARQQVPHIRLGRRLVRFDAGELETWLAAHKVPVASEAAGEPADFAQGRRFENEVDCGLSARQG